MKTYIEPFLEEMAKQVGIFNMMAISGGRIAFRETGITLPVGKGYFVEIDLMPSDTYCVKRVWQTKSKRVVKGVVDDVYSEELGEIAYQASCFVNVSFGGDIK